MRRAGVISGVSVAHEEATVDEIAAASAESARGRVRDLLAREGVEEAFALQTCNRAEAYVVTADAADGRRALSGLAPEVRGGAVRELDHEGSLRHLMRVAAGLESLVVGEDQILGQVRTAFEDARAAGGIGPMLEEAVTKAIRVGERARSETEINEGVVSLGSAAVELADGTVNLGEASALVVGAGEMGTLVARSLAAADVERLVVANRTVPHAEHVASEVDADASAAALEAVPAAAADADVVVTATGSTDHVLEAEDVGGGDETVCIDLGQPRDVDPAAGERPSVSLYDIDDLESVTERTREQRRAAAAAVEEIVDEEFHRLLDAFKRQRADEAIGTMYEAADRVKERELATAVSRLEAHGDLSDDQREAVEDLADALVGQLLAAPTRSLREAAAEDDWTTIQTAMGLFDPEFDAPPDRPETPDGMPNELPDELPDDADIPRDVRDSVED